MVVVDDALDVEQWRRTDASSSKHSPSGRFHLQLNWWEDWSAPMCTLSFDRTHLASSSLHTCRLTQDHQSLLVFIHLSGHILLTANSHKVNLGKQVYLTRCLRLSYGSNSKDLGFQSPLESIKECQTLGVDDLLKRRQQVSPPSVKNRKLRLVWQTH